jgi:hypothetical protein
VKITNNTRRFAAMCGIGWSLFDLLPGRHFNWMDGIVMGLAVAVYAMSYFIKENVQ